MWLSTSFDHGNCFCQPKNERDACIGNRDAEGSLIIELAVRNYPAKHTQL